MIHALYKKGTSEKETRNQIKVLFNRHCVVCMYNNPLVNAVPVCLRDICVLRSTTCTYLLHTQGASSPCHLSVPILSDGPLLHRHRSAICPYERGKAVCRSLQHQGRSARQALPVLAPSAQHGVRTIAVWSLDTTEPARRRRYRTTLRMLLHIWTEQ